MIYDAFLSYNRRDLEWATRLYGRLGRFRVDGRPLKIFFAPSAVTAGQSIPRTLSDALDNSQHLLVVLSPDWVSSEWCQLESQMATWRDPSASHRVVLPLMVAECDRPAELRHIRYIDFRDESKYETSLRELVDTLRASVSRSVQTVVRDREREAILNEPILPWLGFRGPNFDFLWPEMIIDPLVWTRKHPAPQQRLLDWVRGYAAAASSSVAIVGEPGVGKTTALRSLLLSDSGKLPKRRAFVHFRDLPARAESLIAAASAGDGVLCIIIDGLDEVGSDRIPEIVSVLARLMEANATIIIASRMDFFERQFNILKEGLLNLVEVLELGHWKDSDILDFTSRYSARIGHPDLAAAVERLLRSVYGARNMLGNPMRLTLLLYLMATGTNVDVINLAQPYSLYDTFYREWIRKERSRGTGGFDPAFIRSAHTEIAHQLNEYKGELVNLRQLSDVMGWTDFDLLMADTAFQGLLTLREDESDNPTTPSFRHETIGEFLIARDILESFGGTVEQLRRALRVTMRHDVNSFVRSGLNIASRPTVERYFTNLSGKYQELFSINVPAQERQGGLDAKGAEKLRQQILYYIGRMPLDVFPEILRNAFRTEPRPLLRRSAALGAMLHGDFVIEQEYIALLDDPRDALLNRSVQMVNFGDVRGDMDSFIDCGQDWSRTRAAIYERFTSSSIRDIRLRWWDMKTLRSFYESRQYQDKLTEQQRRLLEDVSLVDPTSKQRSAALQEEHRRLVAALTAAGQWEAG